jgi:hypothetical protein
MHIQKKKKCDLSVFEIKRIEYREFYSPFFGFCIDKHDGERERERDSYQR